MSPLEEGRSREVERTSSAESFFVFLIFYLFIHEREREREAETQAEGKAVSMQGAERGTQFWVSRIRPWAKVAPNC